MSLAQIEALYNAAVAALAAGDYDTAIQQALGLKLRLSTTPNIKHVVAGGGQETAWANVVAIDSFITDCRKQKAAALAASSAGPYQQTQIIYERPDVLDCF